MGTYAFLKVLPEMVTFTRVAELGSFSAAADQLGMTPSAASRQVRRLEQSLGVQLLLRTTRQLRLTEAGVEALARCSELVAAAQATMEIGQQHAAAPRGRVRLSAPKAFARRVLQPHLLSFLQRYPEVDLQLIVDDRDIDPIREGVDLVVRLTQDPPPGLAARPLMRVEHLLCAAPHYLAQHPPIARPADLAAHSCLALGETAHDHHWRFRRGDEEAEVRVQGRCTVNHSEIRLESVKAGLGVGCIQSFVAQQALDAGEVVRVLADWAFQARYHGQALILYPPSRFAVPKCRVLIDHLVTALATR
ncbi:LysR family transcriptional regulator [Variovorax ginsengisoli]|uniref:DNA-binding transcriptional LysR family regulator n=1 Tax=Variovorax ginsengisoli TaxID=363844 RepID=A0ABT9S6W8_9BURK|nr:LysR family transcriptional regulator [Variovorax ginsengisoli]MDP9899613.1 DNA-binding transcriptional LysR family regulator [Variovorax ginsengisoli]